MNKTTSFSGDLIKPKDILSSLNLAILDQYPGVIMYFDIPMSTCKMKVHVEIFWESLYISHLAFTFISVIRRILYYWPVPLFMRTFVNENYLYVHVIMRVYLCTDVDGYCQLEHINHKPYWQVSCAFDLSSHHLAMEVRKHLFILPT